LRILRLNTIIRSIKPGLIRNQIDSSIEEVYIRRRIYIREEEQIYFYRKNVKSEESDNSKYGTTLRLIQILIINLEASTEPLRRDIKDLLESK